MAPTAPTVPLNALIEENSFLKCKLQTRGSTLYEIVWYLYLFEQNPSDRTRLPNTFLHIHLPTDVTNHGGDVCSDNVTKSDLVHFLKCTARIRKAGMFGGPWDPQ